MLEETEEGELSPGGFRKSFMGKVASERALKDSFNLKSRTDLWKSYNSLPLITVML